MITVPCLLVATLAAAADRPPLTSPVLTPDAQPGFERLQAQVNDTNALGTGVTVKGVAIASDRATLQLSTRNGDASLTLRHPGPHDERGRFFSVALADGATAVDGEILRRLPEALSRAFSADPWLVPAAAVSSAAPARSEPVPGPSMLTVVGAMAGILLIICLLIWT
jgi:hypothetical protein